MSGLLVRRARPHPRRGPGLACRAWLRTGGLGEGRHLCHPLRVRGVQELASECLGLCPHPGGVLRPVSAVAGCAGLCLETDLLSHSAVSSGQLVDPKSVTLKMFIGLCCVGDGAHITACWEEPVGGPGGLCACSAQEGAAHDPLELALELARGEEGETRLAEGPKFGLYL